MVAVFTTTAVLDIVFLNYILSMSACLHDILSGEQTVADVSIPLENTNVTTDHIGEEGKVTVLVVTSYILQPE